MIHSNHVLQTGLAALILLLALPASAKDEDCSVGSSCFCDVVKSTDPAVVFCEDFESPSLDQNGGPGWVNKYGGVVDGCYQKGLATGAWVNTVEGTCPTCCVDVVKETTCGAAGQSDCVFQGKQAMGHRSRPGETQGIVGSTSFEPLTTFGITMAVKYSRNYVLNPYAMKTDDIGTNVTNCILGCSSGTYLSNPKGIPFHGLLWWNGTWPPSTYTVAKGKVGNASGQSLGWYPNVPADWDFERDHGIDSWHCWQVHVSRLHQTGGRIRHWMDSRLLVDIQNIDLTGTTDSSVNTFTWNNYTNEGYPGATPGYRYQDNVVITRGSEPVSCQALGFGTGFPPPGQLGVPGQPKLVP